MLAKWPCLFYSHNPTLSIFYPREIDPDSQKAANLNKCDFHPCISCHSKISYCAIFYSLLHKPWIIHIFLNQPIFNKLSFVFLRKRSVQDLSWQQKQKKSKFQNVTQTFMAIKKNFELVKKFYFSRKAKLSESLKTWDETWGTPFKKKVGDGK